MGFMYSNAKGVKQDYQESMRWYQLAAAQDHAGALSNLGFMHQHGQGVEENEARALQFYVKAAKKGDKNAANNRDMIEARIAAKKP